MAGDPDVVIDWRGWIPAGAQWSDPEAPLLWFRLGSYRFDDPYYSDTLLRCARHPYNLTFARRTPFDALEEAASSLAPPRLRGIIFHLSRCGSTLVSRALQALPGALVIAEAPPIDAIVRAPRRRGGITREQQIRWLRATVAIAANAHGNTGACFLKADAWHTLDIELFERAFPGIPWIYVYRDAVEVLVSHASRMSYMMSLANAADFLGLSAAEAARVPREAYHAQVLGRLAAAVIERGAQPDALVKYDDLPHALWDHIAPRFGVELDDAQLDAIRRASRYDAKRSGVLFADDRAAKHAAASELLRSAAALHVVPRIQQLDVLRARR